MLEITEQNFAAFVADVKLSLIMFTDKDCLSCQKAKAVLPGLEGVRVGLVSARGNHLAARWRITSLPTWLLFRDGRFVGRRSGWAGFHWLEEWVMEND